MKVIFLDIDGVLNIPAAELGFMHMGENWRQMDVDWEGLEGRRVAHAHVFCPRSLYNLRRVIEATGAKIVVSSTWRHGASLEEMKCWFGDPLLRDAVIGKTDSFDSSHYPDLIDKEGRVQRGEEIYDWVDKHPEVKAYAVLDDDDDMDAVRRNFFQTDGYEGITWKLAGKIIEHLTDKVEYVKHHWALNKAFATFIGSLNFSLDEVPGEEMQAFIKKIGLELNELSIKNDTERQRKWKEAQKEE